MDLFDYMRAKNMEQESPLAQRMRPTTLEEIVGQEHILGEGKLLYRAIKADKVGTVIFYGPPGTGKTTLARVIANCTSRLFVQLNATTSGKKEMEEAMKEAKNNLGMYGKKTILFIDEIHRFNKAQQDFLLPFVEDGTVSLIGATTENPFFEINGALVSRANIFELFSLSNDNLKTIIKRAVYDEKKGMGNYGATITEEALEFLANMAQGDARTALNAIELGIMTTKKDENGMIHITLEVAEECIQKRAFRHDKSGDSHYDTVSAFIKSMRGSDPDASLYYLAKMLEVGEDISFIARRIIICASEDVGNADPNAIQVAVACANAAERVGNPEARIPLAQAVSYIASAPKSNAAYLAINEALSVVKNQRVSGIPNHLKDCHYKGASKLGHGIGYQYAHDFPHHYVKQQYIPDSLVGSRFYEPTENGYEKNIKEYLSFIKSLEE